MSMSANDMPLYIGIASKVPAERCARGKARQCQDESRPNEVNASRQRLELVPKGELKLRAYFRLSPALSGKLRLRRGFPRFCLRLRPAEFGGCSAAGGWLRLSTRVTRCF